MHPSRLCSRQGEVVVFAGVEFREVEVVKFLRVVWVEVVVMVNPHLLFSVISRICNC